MINDFLFEYKTVDKHIGPSFIIQPREKVSRAHSFVDQIPNTIWADQDVSS